MNRRTFGKEAGAALAASLISRKLEGQDHVSASKPISMPGRQHDSVMASVPTGPAQQVGMLMYLGMTPLDLVGPHAFLSGLMNIQVHLLWRDLQPIQGDRQGLSVLPTTVLKDCPSDLDVLFVPGGPGTAAMMRDQRVLDFLADHGARARYVTSVCTGSLILGAAGLLKGYKATSHWNTRDILPLLGAIPVEKRVVEDRNRITGAGVTSGIDFGLVIAAKIRDRIYAEMLQLVFEYDPRPPFSAGTPKEAGPELTAHLQRMLAKSHEAERQAAINSRTRLGLA